ncbi:biotin synthase [Paucibacter sp. R3-3]|uniref:Biotin synthase n=1 Tax=Roseateles agri TaxID=3098619 RepID=A0ABU5DDG5_9BURK|nr:biotin synthase [Paucibacter sp. R3-3]MDY0743217.1 biotin synthase [Paucibacter sp. R3-3]
MSESIIAADERSPRPQRLDRVALLRHARRLAAAPAGPWLHAEVAQRMAERLAIIKLQPQRWLQWSAFLGAGGEALAQVYKGAEQLWVEPTPELLERSATAAKRGWLQRLKGAPKVDVSAPDGVAPGQAQLVWANMTLHAHADLPGLLAQWQAALAVNGFVMFSCLGPDSFVELRPLFAARGWGRIAPDWWDMHDIGDLVVGAGFADPVMDQERIMLTWGEPEALLKDLRALGGNVAPDRFPGLRGRGWRRELLAALEGLRGADGRLRLSLEVVYGHAFKAAPKLKVQPETHVSLDQMREMVRQASQ